MEEKNTSEQKPILDPAHELPAPHDMELPPPHDMLLPQQHILHKHKWLFILPALIGLVIGIVIGAIFLGGSNKEQKQPVSTPSMQKVTPTKTVSLNTTMWKTVQIQNSQIKVPPEWQAEAVTSPSAQYENFIYIKTSPIDPTQTAAGTDKDAYYDFSLVTKQNRTVKAERDEIIAVLRDVKEESKIYAENSFTIIEGVVTQEGFLEGNKAKYALTQKNGRVYIFIQYNVTDENQGYFNEILNTFEFATSASSPTSAPVLNNSTGPSYCTQEVMTCPDGSSVSRIGPNCEFAPCTTQQP